MYKIQLADTEEVVGIIELREIDKRNKIGRICKFLILDKTNRGKGIGKKALIEVLRIGFEEFKLKKITLGVFEFNESAIKCYEGVGFKKEKYIRNTGKLPTGEWSLYEMSISKSEWQIRKDICC
ncbi:GNAT family N-acetyltransferase [Clostridium cavendishii]|uniref:GNAT family N-acetyltransferase n=1 Tax=Clostridium cavendishii TaxID=349931 RepID=UPI002420402B|nr:GNAT family protein [Clostridium cavendishii]